EALVAVPVAGGIVAREHVELDRTRRCLLLPQQLAETAEAAALRIALHDLVVRRHERAVLADTDLLASEQYFGRARSDRIGVLGEEMAQHDLRELVHEERRDIHAGAGKETQVRGRERR